MNVWTRLKSNLRSLFGMTNEAAELLRAECLRLATISEPGLKPAESFESLIKSVTPLQLQALASVLRERATRRVDGMELPTSGRSSVEGTLADAYAGSLSFWGSVSPVIDFEMLALLKHLSIHNPDMSQYVANVVNLGNTGHQLMIDASSKRRSEQAIARLNEGASRLYKNGAGIDGLINAYLRQVAVFGALSSEDVVNFSSRRVEKVVIVPVEQIRFRYLEGNYIPHQQSGLMAGLARSPLGLIRLSDETYRYYALETVENSPYAKPPASAAVAAIIGPQTDMLKNISYIVKKFGLLGVMAIKITRPAQNTGEDFEAYRRRLRAYQAEVGEAAKSMSGTGLIVTYEDQTPEHHNITSDARGAAEIYEKNEQQVFSGMATIPAFHGRTDSSTETYADVMYNFMKGQSSNMQRLPKRRQERTYMLDLRLGGIQVESVSVGFHRPPARNPVNEANADQVRADTAIAKAKAGVISPDAAAQEMGYDSWYDPSLLSANPAAAQSLSALVKQQRPETPEPITLRFDRDSQSYRLLPAIIQLGGETATTTL